jgi:hypothetical protein
MQMLGGRGGGGGSESGGSRNRGSRDVPAASGPMHDESEAGPPDDDIPF